METAIGLGVARLHDLLQAFNEAELHGDLRADSEKWEKHALVERE